MTNIFNWQDTQNNNQLQPTNWAHTLFVNEQDALNKMLNAWIQKTEALNAITEKRKSMLWQISQQEWNALIKMAKDWVDIWQAVSAVKENRNNNLPLWKKALKIPFNLSVWATSLAAEQTWNLFDFVTWWQVPYFQDQVKWIKDVTDRSFKGETWFQAGRNIFWAWEAFAVWPNKMSNTLLWRTAQWAALWGLFWAADPILSKGANATPWEILKQWALWATIWAVATPVLEKWVLPILSKVIQKTAKYWTAWIKGWVEWLNKSITRDIKAPINKVKLEWLAPNKAAILSTKANRFNAKDIEDFKKMTWETPWEFAVTRWMTKVWNEAVWEATKLYQKSMWEANKALDLIDWKFKITKWPDFLWEMLTDLSSRLKKTIWTWWRKINLLLKKYNTQWLSMSEINEVKRLYSKNFKYSWLEAWSESALRSKNIQDWVRKWQFKTASKEWLSNLKQINKTTQGWKTFADSLAKKLKRSSWNNNISLTDWVALSWWNPTNVALFLGKKVWELTPVKRALIKTLWKQTKPSTIKANNSNILKSNIKKRGNTINNILSDRISGRSTSLLKKPKPKALPLGRQNPIITPQTKEKAIIAESNKELSKAKISTTKTSTKPVKKLSKSINNKSWFINPSAIARDIAKLPKITSKNIDLIASKIVKGINIAKEYLPKAKAIVRRYLVKHWNNLKNKVWDLLDEMANKIPWVKSKLLQDTGKTLNTLNKVWTKSTSKQLIKEAKKYKSADEFIKGLEKKWDIVYHWTNTRFDKFDNAFIWKWMDNTNQTWWGMLWNWIYLTSNKNLANKFWEELVKYKWWNTNVVKSLIEWKTLNNIPNEFVKEFIKNNPNSFYNKSLKELTPVQRMKMFIWQKEVIDSLHKYAKSNWFVWLERAENSWYIEKLIFDAKNIKTESQLKQIYKQAHK